MEFEGDNDKVQGTRYKVQSGLGDEVQKSFGFLGHKKSQSDFFVHQKSSISEVSEHSPKSSILDEPLTNCLYHNNSAKPNCFKHRVYASVEKEYPIDFKCCTNLAVSKTVIRDCLSKCGSLDQIGVLPIDNESAIYGSSSMSLINDFACSRNELNCGLGITVILDLILNRSLFSSASDNLDSSNNLGLCSSISSNKCLGENNFTGDEKIISLVAPVPIIPVNMTVASTISSIYANSLYFLRSDLFTSIPSLIASSSDILDLEAIFLNSSNISSSFSLFNASSLANSDQFIQDRCFISDLILSGTENVTDTIYNSPLAFNSSSLRNSSTFITIILRNTSDHLTDGCLSNLSFNSLGIANVTVAILSPPNYVSKRKYVYTYKAFDSEEDNEGNDSNSGFELMLVTDVYSELNDGKEVYFLNAFNESVRVLGIEKEPYSGKIYDVDVGNDVVLVRRLGGDNKLSIKLKGDTTRTFNLPIIE